ncbi:MAG: hypothetical protein MJE77_07605 [Proteobacteria bacterium]|nr:hypothetical protein [Pseudomonadota bacterium]
MFSLLLSMYWVGGLYGCVFPPPLERDSRDAGVNSIPVIVSIDSEHQPPGPLVIDTTLVEMGEIPAPITLTVRDLDLTDQVHVYFYVDYDNPNPTPPRNECRGPAGQLDRVLSCEIDRLCQDVEIPSNRDYLVEAMVVDRMPSLTGEPLFRSVPEGTGVSFQSWLLRCEG